MEKDDFKYTLSFGEDVFGGPRWRDLVGAELADRYAADGTVPILCDTDGMPIQRNFVHVEDLVSAVLAAIDHPKARQQTFNICMDEPVNYARVAEHLRQTRAACPRSRSAPHATRTGWITRKPSFCSAGGPPMTCRV